MDGYDKFTQQVLRKTGLDLSLYKEKQMKRRIESLIRKNSFNSFDSYFSAINTDKALFDEFINYLTINVSEFYRNPTQWQVLNKELLPELLKKSPNLKVWSAACSTGEEPYTTVMVLSNHLPLNRIKVLAVDIDSEAMSKAKLGVYSEKSIANVPKEFVTKYFTKLGNGMYAISEEIKKCVEFKQMNLLKDPYPRMMDLIICRNVMIYFTEEAKDEIYSKFSNSLVNGGILYVGSTEQIISPSKYKFKSPRTFFYEKSQI